MKILITGFEPFDGDSVNPAIEAVKLLPDTIEEAEIIKLELPTVFYESAEVLESKMQEVMPDVVINVGQAGGRFAITPERVAINIDDASIPDNKGNQPIDEVIQEDGEAAYFSTLPIKAMVEEIKSAGLPASVSNTAGTYVCNHIMYQALYLADKKFKGTRAGFIHIPFMNEQVVNRPNTPAMSLSDIARGLEAAVRAVVKNSSGDIKTIGGKTH